MVDVISYWLLPVSFLGLFAEDVAFAGILFLHDCKKKGYFACDFTT